MRLIDVSALKEWVKNWLTVNRYYHPYSKRNDIPIDELYDILKSMPSVDAVEVVRCKDCIHKPYVVDVFHASYGDIPRLESNGKCPCINADDYFYSHMPDDDWFCADGERREEE